MRIVIVTDAWRPQVNGVITTLVDLHTLLLARRHDVQIIEPSAFARFRCPGYAEIELAWRPRAYVERLLEQSGADAVHIATEGPLGRAARAHCLRRGKAFTTAFHTRFPEFPLAAYGIPEAWGYAVLRRFHSQSHGVLVPSSGTYEILRRRGFSALRRWPHGIDLELFQPVADASLALPRPVLMTGE